MQRRTTDCPSIHVPSIQGCVAVARTLIFPVLSLLAASRVLVGQATLPTGQTITPAAARGAIFQELDPQYSGRPDIRASGAGAVRVSPDGRMLAILTSGPGNFHFDRAAKIIPEISTADIFIFDISGAQPKQVQVLQIPHALKELAWAPTQQGLTWSPSSNSLFVSSGGDDSVLEFVKSGRNFEKARTFSLGHRHGVGLVDLNVVDPMWDNLASPPRAGDLAVSPDGKRLLVANFQNDSVSLIDLKSSAVVAEQDLRPGKIDARRHGQPGGSYPRSVVWTSANLAYVASERDREVIKLAISGARIHVVRRLAVHGQPIALVANRSGSRLYVALDNTDQVAVVDTAHDTLVETFGVAGPEAIFPKDAGLAGVNPNALALMPDESTLLVSNGGENAVAVVQLSENARGILPRHAPPVDRDGDDDDASLPPARSAVVGLVPTGWYPTGVATSKNGATWYVVNAKSETGPSAGWCRKIDPLTGFCLSDSPADKGAPFAQNGLNVLLANDDESWQLEKAGFLTFPLPAPLELAQLTKLVAQNNHFDRPEKDAKDEDLFSFLRAHIHHVIYVVKENRTYDQVLGDLAVGNGDPRLAIFPERIAPNHHAIARTFATLDNFLVSGEGSNNGWDWSTAARTNDFTAQSFGEGPDIWGANRSINMGYATSAERHAERPVSPLDPDIVPGARDVTELDGPGGVEGKGYIWDAALQRGLTVRNYGFYEMLTSTAPLVHDPFAQGLRVFFPTKASLMAVSDPYFRGWDPAFPDYWRMREWKREFDAYSASKSLPQLMLVDLGNDHLGSFDRAIDGVNTPETQFADNDYALGLLIESVAKSPFAADTLIVVTEDDPCDGPDHVDAFRSIALFAGPFVRRGSLVSTRYTTVSLVKTIEEILGIGPVGLNDALASPMSDVFDRSATTWSYTAIVPHVLRSTQLPLPPDDQATIAVPKRPMGYWKKAMAGQNFSGPDRVDPASFNHALWRGLKGDQPYPAVRSGADLRENRNHLLESSEDK
jgi:DNA-binding beta-propeller fold protein YncE